MNYQELRGRLQAYLNRTDCTDTLADMFLQQGIERVERMLRTQWQREIYATVLVIAHEEGEPMPTNFSSVFAVTVDGVPFFRQTFDGAIHPRSFQVAGNNIVFNVQEVTGKRILVDYYRTAPVDPAEGDVSEYTSNLSSAALSAGLFYACLYFTDVRATDFKQDMADVVEEIEYSQSVDAFQGGVAVRPYGGGLV